MVNTERLVFGPVLLDSVKQLTRRVEILPEGLLNDDAVDAALGIVAVLLDVFGDGDKHAGRKGEVEDAVALLRLVLCLNLVEVLRQPVERRAILIRTGHVAECLLERLNGVRDFLVLCDALDVRRRAALEVVLLLLCARIADDFGIAGEETLAEQRKERRKGLR